MEATKAKKQETKKKAKREAKEAKEKARREAKEAEEKKKRKAKEAKEREKREAKEAKEKAKRDAKEAKEKAKREAKEAKEARKKPKKAKPPKEKGKKTVVAEGVELYQGMVTLNIMPPVDPVQLDSLKRALLEVEDLRVVMVSGVVDEGSRVLVSAAEPLPLLNILRGIPAVRGVVPKGDEIEVSLEVS
jgi:hypothetical protein